MNDFESICRFSPATDGCSACWSARSRCCIGHLCISGPLAKPRGNASTTFGSALRSLGSWEEFPEVPDECSPEVRWSGRRTRLAAIWQELRSDARIMESPTGSCRTFNRTEAILLAEDMDRLQREYAQACKWIKDLGSALPFSSTDKIDARTIDAAPKVTDMVKRIADFAATFNGVLVRRATLLEQSKRSSGEQFMVVIAGILLVFALALRLTKVTGEIRLDQK